MVEAIAKEIILQSDYLPSRNLETIYFGGGTPSVLTYEQINYLFQAIYSVYTVGKDAEITFESNPDDLTDDYLKMLQKTPVNRLSIGIQTFSDEYLKLMNRRHSGQEAKDCLQRAGEAGFNNITADLIYGLPRLSLSEWEETIHELLQFPVDHISAYHLSIEPKTAFNKFIKTNKFQPLPEDDSLLQFKSLIAILKTHGFEQYEISNFARNESFSKHNTSYWQQVPYLGVGPSAHSYNMHERAWNIAHNQKYIEAIEEGNVPHGTEHLSPSDRYNELVFTSLRTKWGVNDELLKKEHQEYYDYFLKNIESYISAGDAVYETGNYVLTENGRFIADKIASDLFYV